MQINADRMANSVDPDQTCPQDQSDLGLHFMLRPIRLNTLQFYGISIDFADS